MRTQQQELDTLFMFFDANVHDARHEYMDSIEDIINDERDQKRSKHCGVEPTSENVGTALERLKIHMDTIYNHYIGDLVYKASFINELRECNIEYEARRRLETAMQDFL